MTLKLEGLAARMPADAPFTVRVTGASPGRRVGFEVRLLDYQDAEWDGTFSATADAAGVVDLGTTALDGFDEPDPATLLWALERSGTAKQPAHGGELVWTVKAVQDDACAEGRYIREFRASGVTSYELEAPLAGRLYLPSGTGPRPAVITLTGSGGGINREEAELLASRGFVCLALAYFNYPGRPDDLFEQPLEYFRSAVEWLAAHRAVRADSIAVKGQSRGAELSLLLGSHIPGIKAVVAVAPSGYVWGSFTSDGRDGAAWTLAGRPVPTVTAEDLVPLHSAVVDGAVEATPGFRAAVEATPPDELEEAEIPIEQGDCSVLLVCGDDDAMWDAVALSDVLLRRADTATSSCDLRRVILPNAGHNLSLPYTPVVTSTVHPVNGVRYAYGGTRKGTADARVTAWNSIIDFLEAALP
ncbi:acyl-CoA thioester hydrolase/BAAT C-terminal domain-containing protein [Aeromicrobium sp. P5_D10]